jgi:hypothetical protein
MANNNQPIMKAKSAYSDKFMKGMPDTLRMLSVAGVNAMTNGGSPVVTADFFTPETLDAWRVAYKNAERRLANANAQIARGRSTSEEMAKKGIQPYDYHRTNNVANMTDDYYYGNLAANPMIVKDPMFNARNTLGSAFYEVSPTGDVIIKPDKYDFTQRNLSDGGAVWNLGRMFTSGNNVPVMSINLGNPNSWGM